MAFSKCTNNTKSGPSSTLKFQPSKPFALTKEENIWAQNSVNTYAHRGQQHNNLPYTTHPNTRGYQNDSTAHFWNERTPCYTPVSYLKTYGEKLSIMFFG
jgi:hypothetical protein